MLFNNSDWKLKVTDIDLYTDTVKLDGQSYPLSFAIKTLIPGYFSGLAATSSAVQDIMEQLSVAGVQLDNFFGPELIAAYQQRHLRKQAEAERLAREQRLQEQRTRELFMSEEDWQKELQRRQQAQTERRTFGENLRSATHSAGRSRASIMADLDSATNWMDSL